MKLKWLALLSLTSFGAVAGPLTNSVTATNHLAVVRTNKIYRPVQTYYQGPTVLEQKLYSVETRLAYLKAAEAALVSKIADAVEHQKLAGNAGYFQESNYWQHQIYLLMHQEKDLIAQLDQLKYENQQIRDAYHLPPGKTLTLR